MMSLGAGPRIIMAGGSMITATGPGRLMPIIAAEGVGGGLHWSCFTLSAIHSAGIRFHTLMLHSISITITAAGTGTGTGTTATIVVTGADAQYRIHHRLPVEL